jgi:hypothetical protein
VIRVGSGGSGVLGVCLGVRKQRRRQTAMLQRQWAKAAAAAAVYEHVHQASYRQCAVGACPQALSLPSTSLLCLTLATHSPLIKFRNSD